MDMLFSCIPDAPEISYKIKHYVDLTWEAHSYKDYYMAFVKQINGLNHISTKTSVPSA